MKRFKEEPLMTTIDEDKIFKYIDNNSGKGGITEISSKFENQRIAIIGLGGTGSYIFYFTVKTPVKNSFIWY